MGGALWQGPGLGDDVTEMCKEQIMAFWAMAKHLLFVLSAVGISVGY